jgi:hypothetical protein
MARVEKPGPWSLVVGRWPGRTSSVVRRARFVVLDESFIC